MACSESRNLKLKLLLFFFSFFLEGRLAEASHVFHLYEMEITFKRLIVYKHDLCNMIRFKRNILVLMSACRWWTIKPNAATAYTKQIQSSYSGPPKCKDTGCLISAEEKKIRRSYTLKSTSAVKSIPCSNGQMQLRNNQKTSQGKFGRCHFIVARTDTL